MTFSKNDFKILATLYANDCNNELKSYTYKKICNETELSINKVRKTLSKFITVGYISEGLMQLNAKTFYITQNGIQKIESIGGM